MLERTCPVAVYIYGFNVSKIFLDRIDCESFGRQTLLYLFFLLSRRKCDRLKGGVFEITLANRNTLSRPN